MQVMRQRERNRMSEETKRSETALLLEMARVYRMPKLNEWLYIRLPALFGGGRKTETDAGNRPENAG